MNERANRRTAIAIGAASTLATVSCLRTISARQATPASHGHGDNPSRPAADITVSLTDDALTFPGEVAAGINRVTFTNNSSGDGHVLTFRLPDDVDMDALMADMGDPEAPMPDYLRDQHYPGIPDFPPIGGSQSGFVTYMPGTYIAMNIFGEQTPAMFSVVGDPWGVVPPQADHQIGMVDMTFTGLDLPVAAGNGLWSLVNFGQTWHEIMLVGMPALISADELLEFFMSTESESDLVDAGYFQVGGSGIMSPGAQVWMEWDVQPGAYGAICFAPDNFTGPPHAFIGMVVTFEVE